MTKTFRTIAKLFSRHRGNAIDPDEIFLDSTNLPEFDRSQFEGRIERPIPRRAIVMLASGFLLVCLTFIGRLWFLQIESGAIYAAVSEDNRLEHSSVFATRGVIYDRYGLELASNSFQTTQEGEETPVRLYSDIEGLAHVLGYVRLPRKDTSGEYYEYQSTGQAGVEQIYDASLQGVNGTKIVERGARGDVRSESTIEQPVNGKNITLSLDAELTGALHHAIKNVANEVHFEGGAGVMMDIETGEIIALTSYPEYSSTILSRGKPAETIAGYLDDPRTPFLDRVVSGLYTPGSIVKPFLALGALHENIISPEKQLYSSGALIIPNPYFPDKPSVFRDWRAHGYVDMRHALAVSSDEYFYMVGGGYKDQEGLGISRIDHYMGLFGFGSLTGIALSNESEGVVPTPAWKAENFDGEEWLLGNTYHTAIGQYGFQVTPIQMVRAIAAIGNGGKLLTPVFKKEDAGPAVVLPFTESEYKVVRDGIRLSVLEGTAAALNVSYVKMAAKTGTAELGASKQFVNSLVICFFPY